jgi:restriction system protein
MGAIWFRRAEFVGSAGDTVGYKAGIALSRDELMHHTSDLERDDWWLGADDELIRVRSEEFEEIIEQLLYAVGNIPTPRVIRPDIVLLHRYKRDATQMAVLERVLTIVAELPRGDDAEPVDITPVLTESERVAGADGLRIALEFVDGLELYLHANPWTRVRRTTWTDVADLQDLFTSASLDTQYGAFFDQRYIDYLAQNFERIDEIHWRKFEALTSEHFERQGWRVEIGPGGNDDGVDVRVWSKDEGVDTPPAILIQCKRQKDTIGKVVVKALWADVVHENATSGLIVTTSTLAAGAQKVCRAREYPVRQADRNVLRKWVQAMRTPGTGAFLSE